LLIQQHINGSNAFNRSWAEYKVGFNDSRGNYWLGNDLLSQLTLTGRYKLRMALRPCHSLIGNLYLAETVEYSTFIVQPEWSNYRLNVSGYLGNPAYNVLFGNQFEYINKQHNISRQTFTTYDRDNDNWSSGNCASELGSGFWYNACSWFSMNCNYFHRHDNDMHILPMHGGENLQTSRMWLQCK